MVEEKIGKRILKMAVASMVVAGIFWGAWYFFAKSIPNMATQLTITSQLKISLPMISRLWDIGFIGIWTAIFVLLLSEAKEKGTEAAGVIFFGSILIGVYNNLLFSLVVYLIFGMICGLYSSIVPRLKNKIRADGFKSFLSPENSIRVPLSGSLFAGIIFGSVSGICVGVIAFFGFTVGSVLGFYVVDAIKFTFDKFIILCKWLWQVA